MAYRSVPLRKAILEDAADSASRYSGQRSALSSGWVEGGRPEIEMTPTRPLFSLAKASVK
jgi:hypothetical protein